MQPRDHPEFASPQVETFWSYICSSLDRLAGLLDGSSPEVLNWRPPAPKTNSLFVLMNHTMENARTNLLGNLCGQVIAREREGEFMVKADRESQEALMESWQRVREELQEALSRLPTKSLDDWHTHHWRGDITGLEILIIVARHAAEHLGQAELTRDLAIAALRDNSSNPPQIET